MLKDKISINKILENLEGVLQLEPNDMETPDVIIRNAIRSLERSHNCTLDKDVYTVQAENALTAGSLDGFLRDVTRCLEELALYNNLSMVHGNVPFNLADVNYLGVGKPTLVVSLQYLLNDKSYRKMRSSVMKPIKHSLAQVTMCQIKRLFYIMLMFDELGIYEGASIVAQLLYIGGAA